MSSFCGVFLTRYLHRLSEEQLAVVAQWERELCVSETELVEKFLEMLGRREADLKLLGASSVEQLFSGHSKKTDEDLRFGYDFVRRQWSQLAPADQERIRKALEPLIHKVEQMPVKEFHDAKLHAGETVLGDQLPRPRLPKSLRQLYGNSMDAEARIMPFFHRVHEVDAYMLDMEFQDCAYCKEGWFGIATGRGKSRLPGGFESQAFQKTNFCRAPEKEWLEPGKPICENCLHEAKARAKAQLPKEPFRLTAANHADPGDSLPETDALTFSRKKFCPRSNILFAFLLCMVQVNASCEDMWVTCFKMVRSSSETFPQQLVIWRCCWSGGATRTHIGSSVCLFWPRGFAWNVLWIVFAVQWTKAVRWLSVQEV